MSRPDLVGLNPDRWRSAARLADELVASGELVSVAIAARHATADDRAPTPAIVRGHVRRGGPPLTPETPFLVASLTKPMVAALALRMAEAGRLSLSDRVADWVPEFRGGRKRPVTVRHLLCHASGLPDVWPRNTELRQAKATRAEFAAESAAVEMTGRPGRQTVYSSVGYSLLGWVLEKAGGAPLPGLMKDEIFTTLAMDRSALGRVTGDAGDSAGGDAHPAAAAIDYPPEHEPADWDWNSRYWREMGAPWGGLTAPAGDVMKFLGAFAAGEVVSPAARDAAWADHRQTFSEAGGRPWGLGWRFAWPGHAASFGDLLPAESVGHYGATGTLMWHSRGRLAVLLTTRPALGRPRSLQLLSNAVAAAFEDAPAAG